jgi:hypothetical protein
MDAVAIEKEFVTDAIPVRLIGMNSDLMGHIHRVRSGSIIERVRKRESIQCNKSF